MFDLEQAELLVLQTLMQNNDKNGMKIEQVRSLLAESQHIFSLAEVTVFVESLFAKEMVSNASSSNSDFDNLLYQSSGMRINVAGYKEVQNRLNPEPTNVNNLA